MSVHHCIIIGAGQAGLAVSHALRSHGIPHRILDDRKRVGDVWRERWDSLTLFTPPRYSSLPGLPFPPTTGRYPTAQEMGDYLEAYARHFQLPVTLQEKVTRAEPHREGWRITTATDEYISNNIVVATGAFAEPFVPSVATIIGDSTRQLHSSKYQNPAGTHGQRIVVAGTGSSGTQIALELAGAGREVWLAGRNMRSLPRHILGVDIYTFLIGWRLFRISRDSKLGRKLMPEGCTEGDWLLGQNLERSARQAGVKRMGKIHGWNSDGLVGTCGTRVQADTVIWATGYRNTYPWIDAEVLTPAGAIDQYRGKSRSHPGLYFVGQKQLHHLGSSLIAFAAVDAAPVANAIAVDFSQKPRSLHVVPDTASAHRS